MKELNPDCGKMLENYLQKLAELLKAFPKDERDEIVLEIRSHIEEKFAKSVQDGDEIKALKNILDKLGKPEEYASEYVTDYLLDQGMARKKVLMIFQGLLRWGSNTLIGFFYVLFLFVSYLVSVSVAFIGIIKPVFPENVGIFMKEGHVAGFGWIKEISAEPGVHEVLGNLIIPAALAIGITGLFITSWLLKRLIRSKFGLRGSL